MTILIIGLVLLFTQHSLNIFAPRWRERTRAKIGRATWGWLYSLASIVFIGLIAWGYAQARYAPIVVYVGGPWWLRRVTDVLMLGVFPLLYATFLPGRIRTALKYPDLVAIKLWAVAHLLVNGMLADLFLFGGFLTWAVVNRISLKRRVRILPSAAPSSYNDLVAIIAGLVTYLIVIGYAHYKIIGVAPV
jgi:uncharacterized membrane protein